MQQKANEIFKIEESANCGPIAFEFVKDDQVPLSFDSSTGTLSLNPMTNNPPTQFLTKQAKFYLKEYPELSWSAPILVNILECLPNEVILDQKQISVEQEIGSSS